MFVSSCRSKVSYLIWKLLSSMKVNWSRKQSSSTQYVDNQTHWSIRNIAWSLGRLVTYFLWQHHLFIGELLPFRVTDHNKQQHSCSFCLSQFYLNLFLPAVGPVYEAWREHSQQEAERCDRESAAQRVLHPHLHLRHHRKPQRRHAEPRQCESALQQHRKRRKSLVQVWFIQRIHLISLVKKENLFYLTIILKTLVG